MLNVLHPFGHLRFSTQIQHFQQLPRSSVLAAVGSGSPVLGAGRDNFRDTVPAAVDRTVTISETEVGRRLSSMHPCRKANDHERPVDCERDTQQVRPRRSLTLQDPRARQQATRRRRISRTRPANLKSACGSRKHVEVKEDGHRSGSAGLARDATGRATAESSGAYVARSRNRRRSICSLRIRARSV